EIKQVITEPIAETGIVSFFKYHTYQLMILNKQKNIINGTIEDIFNNINKFIFHKYSKFIS
ncbi:MAG: hypothetical protein MR405_06475, partial [Mollicutes bacterium]|nr:hypothetical protein [Mollicutes bacterium]